MQDTVGAVKAGLLAEARAINVSGTRGVLDLAIELMGHKGRWSEVASEMATYVPRLTTAWCNRRGVRDVGWTADDLLVVVSQGLAPNAREVSVVAMENQPAAPMTKDDKGVWSVTVGPLAPAIYSYAFKVDGAQVTDPLNPRVKVWLVSNSMVEKSIARSWISSCT